MSFFNLSNDINELTDNIKTYIDDNLKYYKLFGFKIGMKHLVPTVNIVIGGMFMLIFILFLSVAAAIGIGKAIDGMAWGFVIVGGVYLFAFLLFFLFGKKYVSKRLMNTFSKSLFEDEEDELPLTPKITTPIVKEDTPVIELKEDTYESI